MGIETPPNAAAELGGKVHAELEKYLLGGEIDFTTEAGYIAASGLEHLPKPGTPGLHVEEEFHFFGPSGHSYLGYKDVELSSNDGIGIVYDHKTTSDFRWQKTADDLKKDIQAILYAVDYFRRNPDAPEVELRWVYYRTKNARKSAVTQLRVNQEHAWKQFLDIEKTADEMQAASTKTPLELPLPLDEHCSAFGGCPHQGRCNLSPLDRMRSYVEQNRLLAKLQANRNGASAAAVSATVAAAAVATVPVVPSAPVMQNRLLAKLQANGVPTATAVAVNPPEYQPPPVAAPVAVPVAVVAPTAPVEDPVNGYVPAAFAKPAEAPVAEAAAPKRGRPKKANQDLGTYGPLPAGSTGPTGPPGPAASPVASVLGGAAVKIGVLYLNCGPVGVPVVDAGVFIRLAKEALASAGIADWRFIDFGKGAGMFALSVAEAVDKAVYTPTVRLDTASPEGSIVLVELMARAALVVR